MTQDVKQSEAESALQAPAYAPPAFECHPLKLITLGGSPGDGDSGSPTTLLPGISGAQSDDYDGESREDDDPWGNGM